MRLTRLEIFGFKSFVDRFALQFDRSIIGVVGPNGCGKSNIVDSLRWVLGETHARQLRGNVLEDLIFNGTQTRRPLGMAEVSITIRPSEGFTPQTLANAQLNRSADEGQESFGEEELQSVFEPSTLNEIPGLFDAAEIQLTRRMYRSGESEYFINRIPCRLRDMLELYRLIGLGARGLSIVEQGQISEIISKKPLERRELLEEAAGISGFRARLEVAQRKLAKTADNLSRLHDIRTEVEKQVRALSRQAKRARERGELKDRLRMLDFEAFAYRSAYITKRKRVDEERLESLRQERARKESELEKLIAAEDEKRAEIETLDTTLSDTRVEKDALVVRVNEHVAQENLIKLELSRLEGKIRLSQATFERAGAREGEIREEISRIGAELEELASSETEFADARARAEQALSRFIAEQAEKSDAEVGGDPVGEIHQLSRAVETLPALSAEIAETEKTLREERRSLHEKKRLVTERELKVASLRAEVKSLEAQLQTLARHVTESTGEAEPNAEARVLLAGIAVPQNLQRAVSAVLGEKSRFALIDDCVVLGEQYEKKHHANSSAKRAQVGVVDPSLQAVRLDSLTEEDLRRAPSAKPLLDLVGVSGEAYNAAVQFLGNVLLVDSLTEGLRLIFARTGEKRIAVTRGGEIVTSWGWYTTSGDGAELSFRRLIDERRESLAEATRVHDEAVAQFRREEEALEKLEERLRQLQDERETLFQAQRRLSGLLREAQQIERVQRDAALKDERKLSEVLRNISTELASVQKSISHQRRRISELEQEVVRVEADRVRISEEQKQFEAEYRAQKEQLEELFSNFRGVGSTGLSPLDELQSAIRVLEEKERKIGQERSALRTALGEVAENTAQARRAFERMSTEDNDTALRIERSSLERDMLLEEMQRFYGAEVTFPSPEESEQLEDLPVDELEQGLKEKQSVANSLRQRLEREGEVDPQSIELYETEKQRLEDIEAQWADLTSATAILERTIRQLKEISRTRFLETFQSVSAKFSELVPRLFGGGSGVLELIEPDDPLQSGVELSVRPPGKKLRSIELMSGGEKALTATALLMAMFLHRPSPICVLDEVDAPLDDANLERFLSLIKDISSQTQFLIITHNKQTMAAADRLVGITMQERGVSKALTVSLDEAVVELERAAANA